MKVRLAAACVLLALSSVGAQEAPRYTASVRRNTSGQPGQFSSPRPGGEGYRAVNATATGLLNAAFRIPDDRILGAPNWTREDRFDVDAKYEDGAQVLGMQVLLRAVLRDRFQLVARVEVRDRPVYLLKTVDGRRSTPGMAPSGFNCTDPAEIRKARERGVNAPNGQPPCSVNNAHTSIRSAGLSLARVLAFFPVDRPIVDATGMTGAVDITMDWEDAGDPVGAQAAFLTALREQLGLRLDSGTAPLDVLIVDSISRPDAN